VATSAVVARPLAPWLLAAALLALAVEILGARRFAMGGDRP
jgi:hypothetical protein